MSANNTKYPSLLGLRHCSARGKASGFSLLEMLVATTIVAALAAVVATGVRSFTSASERAREINAGRQLIAAFHLAATERNGQFLPGYDRTVSEFFLPDGRHVAGPAANRYPFRLASYLDYQLKGTILVNKNARQINTEDIYSVSCYPAFAINYLFVGGDISSQGVVTMPEEVMTRSAQGQNILVFATSGSGSSTDEVLHGFSILTPPRIYGPMWNSQEWTPERPPGLFGNLHARHQGKVACVYLDGSVRLQGVEELRDMRNWSLRARQNNDPDYTVAAPPRPSGRR